MNAFIKRISFIKRIFVFLYVIAITALLVLPSLKYTFSYVQVVIFSIPFVLFAFLDGKTYRKVFLINMILLAITFLCTFVFNYRGNVSGVLNIIVPTYLFVLPLLICQYLIDLNDKVLMKWTTVASCAILIYILVKTFSALSVDPTIARHLAYGTNEDEYINYQRMRNVGGFGFCYCLCMFVPYLTSLVSRVKKKKKIIVIIMLCVLLVFSIYSQYTTFVLLSVISIFYVILTQGKMSVKKVVALVLLLIIVFSFKSILWLLANNLNFTSLSSHFYDLYYMLEGENNFDRWSIYKANIVLFLQHPIFGADLTIHYNDYMVDHAHSHVFARMSGGGIIGLGGFAGFVASAWYYLTKKSKMRYLIPVFLVYIAMAFLNPVQPEISVTVFMVIPLIEYQFVNKEEQYYV